MNFFILATWIIHEPGLFASRDCCSCKTVAHAAVVNYRKWVTMQPMQ